MSDLKRYNILLPVWLYDYLMMVAKDKGISLSAFIRFIIYTSNLGSLAYDFDESKLAFTARKIVENKSKKS